MEWNGSSKLKILYCISMTPCSIVYDMKVVSEGAYSLRRRPQMCTLKFRELWTKDQITSRVIILDFFSMPTQICNILIENIIRFGSQRRWQ